MPGRRRLPKALRDLADFNRPGGSEEEQQQQPMTPTGSNGKNSKTARKPTPASSRSGGRVVRQLTDHNAPAESEPPLAAAKQRGNTNSKRDGANNKKARRHSKHPSAAVATAGVEATAATSATTNRNAADDWKTKYQQLQAEHNDLKRKYQVVHENLKKIHRLADPR